MQTGSYAELVEEEAAALWESLPQNHSFIDGNKRATFTVIWIVLVINGTRWTANAQGTEDFPLGLYVTGTFRLGILPP
nr:Fic family protein [Acetobacter sacchari]